MRCSSRVSPPQLQMPPDFRQRSTAGDRCKTWRQNPWPEPFLCHWSRLPVFSCHEGRGSGVAGGASPQWRPHLGSSLYRARGHRWGQARAPSRMLGCPRGSSWQVASRLGFTPRLPFVPRKRLPGRHRSLLRAPPTRHYASVCPSAVGRIAISLDLVHDLC